jgi:hypothetical protein
VAKGECEFRFTTTEQKVYKIKTLAPVGYDIVKVK